MNAATTPHILASINSSGDIIPTGSIDITTGTGIKTTAGLITNTVAGYLYGVTSNIQTQLNNFFSPSFSSYNLTFGGAKFNSGDNPILPIGGSTTITPSAGIYILTVSVVATIISATYTNCLLTVNVSGITTIYAQSTILANNQVDFTTTINLNGSQTIGLNVLFNYTGTLNQWTVGYSTPLSHLYLTRIK
jgi:hypothetical protein